MENQQEQFTQATKSKNPFKIATIVLAIIVLGLGGLSAWLFIDNLSEDNEASSSQINNETSDEGDLDSSSSQIDTSNWVSATFRSGMSDKYLQFINADFEQFSVSVKHPTGWSFHDEEWDIDSNGNVVPPADSTSVGLYKNLGEATDNNGNKYIKKYPQIFLRGLTLPSSGIYRDTTCSEDGEYATVIKLGNTSTKGYWVASEVVSYNFKPVSMDGDNTEIYIWVTNADESILNNNGIVTTTRCSLNQNGVLSAYPNGDTTATYLRAVDVLNNTNNYRTVLEIFKSMTIKTQ